MCLISLCGVLLLVVVGSSVRSLEAGMGCPDWPKCYGKWLPPFAASQLPANYQEIYRQSREKKIKYLNDLLSNIGLTQTNRALTSAHIYTEDTFHPFKAWVEYGNRILGVLVGLVVLATWLASFSTLRNRPGIFWLCTAALFFTGLAGGLGAIVVFTHLFPSSVSLHMFTTFVIIGCLLAAYTRGASAPTATAVGADAPLQTFLHINYILLFLLFTQIGLGVQLRAEVDLRIFSSLPREGVLDSIGVWFYVHRTASLLLLIAQFGCCFWTRYVRLNTFYQRISWLILYTYIFQILLGATLYYLHLPRFTQPLHLLFAFFSYTLHLYLILYSLRARYAQIASAKASH